MSIIRIGDVCTWAKGYQVPRDDTSVDKEIPYLHYGDLYKLYGFRLDLEEKYDQIIKIDADSKIKTEQYLHDGDIVFTFTSETVDDLGHCTLIINPADRPFVTGMETTVVHITNRESVLPAYLNYYFQSRKFQREVRQFVTGMKVYRVHPDDLMDMVIDIPEMVIQKRIVAALDPFSDKILANTKLNANLLKSARVAFSEMMCTSELSDAVLSDVATITMGQSPPGDSLSEDDTGVLFYQGRAEFGSVFPTPRLYTTDPKRMAKQGSILMSVRAPVGDINVALEKCCIGRGLAAIESNNGMQGFVHYLMDYLKPELDVFNGGGTVFGSINKESVNGLEISLPEQKSAEQFNAYAEKIDAEIRSNHLEMLKLSEIRDYLLPRLMSGEIDVSTSEIPN